MNVLFILLLIFSFNICEEPHTIIIDGEFSDWDDIISYYDPVDYENGTSIQEGVPDVHDTDSTGFFSVPSHVYNPNADIIEYKFTHDSENFYAYFKVSGTVGLTSVENTTAGISAGRYYVIVTIDLDQDVSTGYWLDEGGYYPTSGGYDINFEIEFYNGSFNTGHYLNHGCHNEYELFQAFNDQSQGQIHYDPGFYNYYTEWVFWDVTNPPTESEIQRCPDGMKALPNNQGYLCFVVDKAPGPFQGNVVYGKNENEIELKAPYNGLLKNGDNPFVQQGMTINISFSIETSGQYSSPDSWCSDTGLPIKGYYMGYNGTTPTENVQSNNNNDADTSEINWKSLGGLLIIVGLEGIIIIFLFILLIASLIAVKKIKRDNYQVFD